jgi:hypothetical protein
VDVKLGVKLGVHVEKAVGASNDGLVISDGVNVCKVGNEVGVNVGGGVGDCVGDGVGVAVEVALIFPSASESEKPPSSKPIEARAMKIPRNTCCKFFITGFLGATFPGQASER